MRQQTRRESGYCARNVRDKARRLIEHPRPECPFESAKRMDDLCPAAVLVPVLETGGDARVLLTRRTGDLPAHAGQIAFPGGKIASREESAECAALRETEEETGIHARHIEVLGRLPSHATGTGFLIYPILGIVNPGYALAPCAREVAEIFEVPLDFLMRAGHYRIEQIEWRGGPRHFYVIDYNDYRIWGATAYILKQLQERLFAT